jgi:hypothetical protein
MRSAFTGIGGRARLVGEVHRLAARKARPHSRRRIEEPDIDHCNSEVVGDRGSRGSSGDNVKDGPSAATDQIHRFKSSENIRYSLTRMSVN